ncbi:uncharacterized protein [Miscanthus floridulus]|uniref:uncharacterized protein n=1 Tax=Miscanthus floridulus TaxID=154761 RepID=UPI00345A4A70
MRKLCPNLDRDDSLDTVLEVPIPDEMLINAPSADKRRGARGANMLAWLKNQAFDRATVDGPASATAELQVFLNVVGSPLITCPVPHDRAFSRSIRDSSIRRRPGTSSSSTSRRRAGRRRCRGAEHVRRWEGADVRVRVPPRRPDGHHRRRAGPRRGRRLRALAEDPRGLVLRAHHGRPQDERRQRQQGRVAPVRRRAVPRLARPAAPPPPLSPGPGSTLHREPLLRRGVHRREDPQQRGVLHPEAGGRRGNAAGAERPGVRHHPPHGVGQLQPAHGAAHPARGLAPAAHEVRQGPPPQREHLLGDQHGVRHLRLPLHRRHQHRARRPHQRHALPLRRGVRQPQAQAGGDVDGGGRFQCARPHHGLLPAAGRPLEGRRRSE